MNLTFQEITKENWVTCAELIVDESQRDFVAPNAYSLAETAYAEYRDSLYPLAVYDDDVMVGFIMYEIDDSEGDMGMCRLMIDRKHQKKGYGEAAVKKLIDVMIETYGKRPFFTSFKPENTVAMKLYKRLGFEDTGRMLDEEVLLQYKY